MPFFSRLFSSKDASKRKNADLNAGVVAPPKPKWQEAWSRTDVAPEEVHELIHVCTQEMKSRALDMPFLLLPFRPGSDPVGSKNFIRHYFQKQYDNAWYNIKQELQAELRLMEPSVLCSIMKWCWSRLTGGVVTWEVYELFKTGESDCNHDNHAFKTFVPLSTESSARRNVIFDFFDLLAAIAARGKTNGLGGRKLSRMAGWWAFSHSDNGEGFHGGYESWKKAANATSHMFFAYLRSQSPDSISSISGISQLPRSLQALVSQTEYPPEEPILMFKTTARVLMVVTSVSPTPFALLRRAKHFEFRDDNSTLLQFSEYDDPIAALTDECKRVLARISATNQSTSLVEVKGTAPAQDGAWSMFEDNGFMNTTENLTTTNEMSFPRHTNGLRSVSESQLDQSARPTTPSWADFLSDGFPAGRGPSLLPPDKQLPLPVRGHSSQSHVRNGEVENLDPGELAAVHYFDLDDTFWWVWMTSLAGEETSERKAVFGRCALIETDFRSHPWLVVEEQVKGASPGQDEGVYIAEKKSRFSFSKRGRLSRKKTTSKRKPQVPPVPEPFDRSSAMSPASRVDPDKEDRVKAAARQLADHKRMENESPKRGRTGENMSAKTNSVMTLQPGVVSEAAQAMKWTKAYDNKSREDVRSAYLSNPDAGRGYGASATDLTVPNGNGHLTPETATSPKLGRHLSDRDLPSLPKDASAPEPVRAPPSPPRTPPEDPALLHPEVMPDDEKESIEHIEDHPTVPERSSPVSIEPDRAVTHGIEPSKSQKKQGGLKKLFSRRRADAPNRLSKVPVAQPMPGAGIQRVATNERPKPKSVPISVPVEASYDTSIVDAHEQRDIKQNGGALEALEGGKPENAGLYELPGTSHTAEAEQQHAADEFNRFDQGPLDDVPAIVPEDSPLEDREPVSALERTDTFEEPVLEHGNKAFEQSEPSSEAPSPIIRRKRLSGVSQASADDSAAPAPSVPVASDRWAAIRKNAAARAARLQEEQQQQEAARSRGPSQPESRTTEDDGGETSGEETIESRVARIKARVAELTGNMETANPPPIRR